MPFYVSPLPEGWRSTTCGVIGDGKFNISLCDSMLAVTTNREEGSGGDEELF